METLTIPPEQWTFRLNKLSEAFERWPVSLDVIPRADGQPREFTQIPLLGITAEPNGPIVISVVGETGEHVTHIIHSPTRVLLDKTDRGANSALEIESADGTKTVLRFRSTEVDY
jgi:hypothetical protein